MTSNIQITTIDENFPVAGRDNDTQGFRDNFEIIKTNFAAAKAEIEDLQDNAARKDESNNFLGSKIIDAEIQASTETMYNAGSILTTANISFLNGHYHKYNINSGDSSQCTLTLINWPNASNSNRHAKITVELLSTSGAKTITWASTSATGTVGQFKKSSNWPTVFTVPNSESTTVFNSIVAEFWTYDGGNTVYANYLGMFQ